MENNVHRIRCPLPTWNPRNYTCTEALNCTLNMYITWVATGGGEIRVGLREKGLNRTRFVLHAHPNKSVFFPP